MPPGSLSNGTGALGAASSLDGGDGRWERPLYINPTLAKNSKRNPLYSCLALVGLLAAALHRARRQRHTPAASHAAEPAPQCDTATPATSCTSWLPASERARLTRYAAVGLSGVLIGVSMALYQLMLSDVVDLLWTLFALRLLTPAFSVLFVPPCVLCLAALLMRALPHGHLKLFVRMVSCGEHADLWKAAIGTTVVSILAIASGGSAGPEGPVLAIGAGISLAVHEALLSRRLHAASSAGAQVAEAALPAAGETRVAATPSAEATRVAAPTATERAKAHVDELTSIQAVALIGGCCALSATLDSPIKGCIFGMELPHLYGSIKRGAVFPYALLASCLSFGAHRACMAPFAIQTVPTFPPTTCTLAHLPLAVPLGVLAGGLAFAFVYAREALDRLPYSPVPRALIFGFIVGFIALVLPETLMWGEHRLGILAAEYTTRTGLTQPPAHLPLHLCT